MVFYLISGTRRTGKDTLASSLLNQDEVKDKRIKPWLIYGGKKEWKLPSENAHRISFAYGVKLEVARSLDLDLPIVDSEAKDYLIVKGKLLRNHLIDLAMEKKRIDPSYWVKDSLERLPYPLDSEEKSIDSEEKSIDSEEKSIYKGEEDVVVTDFRFEKDEYGYLTKMGYEVVTIRVFRSEVHIPTKEEDPLGIEHDLDHFQCDFLLVTSEQGFQSAISLYPQYSDYVQCGKC